MKSTHEKVERLLNNPEPNLVMVDYGSPAGNRQMDYEGVTFGSEVLKENLVKAESIPITYRHRCSICKNVRINKFEKTLHCNLLTETTKVVPSGKRYSNRRKK